MILLIKVLPNLLIVFLIVDLFVQECQKFRSKFILLGIPLMLYFIYLQPILSDINISEVLKLTITLTMCLATLLYFFKGICISMDRKNKN